MRRIVFTREARYQPQDIQTLRNLVGDKCSFEALSVPLIDIQYETLEKLINLDPFDWLFITSHASAKYVVRAMHAGIIDATNLSIACIGTRTASPLLENGLDISQIWIAEQATGETMIREWQNTFGQNERNILFLKGDLANSSYGELLRDFQHTVVERTVYRNVAPEGSCQILRHVMREVPDSIIVTSPSIWKRIVAEVGRSYFVRQHVNIYAIGPITKRCIEQDGVKVVNACDEHISMQHVLENVASDMLNGR